MICSSCGAPDDQGCYSTCSSRNIGANDRGPWIQTISGRTFHLLDPSPDEIFIGDIAHALSLINRFTGHLIVPYSVAQHSVLIARKVWEETNDPGRALGGLLHDAAEAYTGDWSRPLKHIPALYTILGPIEARIEQVIAEIYKVAQYDPLIKVIDDKMCMTEKRDLMGGGSWNLRVEPYPETLLAWPHKQARHEFLREFYTLREMRNEQVRRTLAGSAQ